MHMERLCSSRNSKKLRSSAQRGSGWTVRAYGTRSVERCVMHLNRRSSRAAVINNRIKVLPGINVLKSLLETNVLWC